MLENRRSTSSIQGCITCDFHGKIRIFLQLEKCKYFDAALVKAQHSDKESIVDLLKDVSIKSNRSYTDFSLYTLPAKPPIMSQETLKSLDINSQEIMDQDIDLDPDFIKLEKSLCENASRNYTLAQELISSRTKSG